MLLVERFALGNGIFHSHDAVELFAEGAEALVDEAHDGAVGEVGVSGGGGG